MATNYPGSLDTSTQQPSPSASTEMDDSGFEHDVVHANHSGAIIAVETKVGTGASTPVADSVLGGTGSGTSAWTTTPTLGGLTVDTDTLYVDATNNRVGIGTTSPGLSLEIRDDFPAIRLKDTSTTDHIFHDIVGDGDGLSIRADHNGDATNPFINFKVGGSQKVAITSAGRLGIGTASPAATLDVQGSISQPWGNEIKQTGVANTKLIDVNFTGGLGNHVDLSVPNNGSAGLGDTVMRLVDGGNVGIGAATPDTLLHVSGPTDTVAHFESTDAEGMIAFSDSASTGNWYDRRIGVHGDDLSFVTNGARRMTIMDDGRVGIGTTSASAPLHISDDAHAILRLQNEGTGNTEGPTIELYGNTGRMGLLGFDNSDDIRIKNETSAGKLFFFTNNSVRATILPSGNVGIGTDSPANTLHVNGGTANFIARLESTDGEAYLGLQDSASSSAGHVAVGAIGDDLVFRAGNSNAARLKSNGNLEVDTNTLLVNASQDRVGVNHSSPVFPLHAYGSTVDTIVGVESGDAGAYLAFTDSDSTGNAYDRRIGVTGNDLKFQTGATDRMTVKADGKVGIGTTSPGTSLHVNAGAVNNAAIFESTDAGALISLKDNTTSGNSYVGLRADGDILKLRSNNINQVTISANGNVTFLGSLLAPNGSTSAPAYSFANDSNTGFYVTGNGGVIRFVGNGTEGGYVYSGGIRTVNGSASTPSHSFTSDSDTGMYRYGTNSIGFTTAGTVAVVIDNGGSGGRLFGPGLTTGSAILRGEGTAAIPTYTFYGDENTGMYRYGADEIGFSLGGTVAASITGHINVHGTDSAFVAFDPPTGTGNDAEWVSVFGVYLLRRNSSTAAEKLSIQEDLEGWLTPDMVDSVVPKMWTRDHAPDYPEIGPIADDMDAISPFLGVKGTNEDGEQILTGIDRNAYMSLLVLAVKDLRTRVVELENA